MRDATPLTPRVLVAASAALSALVALGCPGGSDSGNPTNVATSGTALTSGDVDRILAGAAQACLSLDAPAAIAVCDREGEVLGVFVTPGRDLDGNGTLETPGEGNIQAAIAKAATAAAFESEGEAFSTRTAYFIVQGHFPPGTDRTAGGPLFGVQDSGQPSSDSHIIAWDMLGNAVGTGISGAFGGVPLHKNGAPVGGVGVDLAASTTMQGSPPSPTLTVPIQRDADEAIAMAAIPPELGTPGSIQATNVFVDGIAFPFTNVGYGPGAAPGATVAGLANPALFGTTDARFPIRASPITPEVRIGGRYGIRTDHRYLGRVVAPAAGPFTNVDRNAGVVFSTTSLTFTTVPIAPLTQANRGGVPGEDRAPPIDSVEPTPANGGLTAAEVAGIIFRAAADADASVAGIRLPRGSKVVVHIAVVDVRGNLLGLFRMGDGTLFSSDVAVQKARTAAFFSSDATGGLPVVGMSARAVGFLSQPFFPPGINSTEPGPLARLRDVVNRGKVVIEAPPSLTLLIPPPRPPSDGTTDEDPIRAGFQTFNDFGGAPPASLAEVRGILGATGGIAVFADRPDVSFVSPGLQSGMQTFAGGVPLYRGSQLIGGVGVSGDGIDEDDSAAFAGSGPFQPPNRCRSDEVPEASIIQVVSARVNQLVTAIQGHPDPRIRDVYGPILVAERSRVQTRLAAGLQQVRIPYVKLPRNPNNP